ncbi:MAG: HNH endonuclease [Clostridia bacterium]|nr:HNH endonuclease [Clostridia bacterium]
MAGRNFSETVKFGAVKANVKKYNGEIRCEICGKRLFSVKECHFDHVIPYAKGGSSTLKNCQILCIECNLTKGDKDLKEISLDEIARRFFGKKTPRDGNEKSDSLSNGNGDGKMTKEKFDLAVGDFIRRNGDIRQIDFSREYNRLPGISYMRKYYGTLNELKKVFGITDISLNWSRDNIKQALLYFVSAHGGITQKDLKKENGLPSVGCILSYFPEYRSFAEIKQGLCNIESRGIWTREEAIQAGKEFALRRGGKLVQSDCTPANNLPAMAAIYRLFGNMPTYQRAVGAAVSRNNYVSEQEIEAAVRVYFENKDRIVESRKAFFESFPYGLDVICGRYQSFGAFAERFNITVKNTKKAKYTKQEVDAAISGFVRSGRPIPTCHGLTKEGLPAASVIMRYYDHWREPFEIFEALYKRIGGQC